MFHLIYASVATVEFGISELTELLRQSREKNMRLGLTGMLLYCNRSFLQVLEGEEHVIDELYQKIMSDPRHTQLATIIREPIPKRYFENWSMGFRSLTTEEISEIEGVNDFYQDRSCLANLDRGRARKLLAAFADGRWQARFSDPTMEGE